MNVSFLQSNIEAKFHNEEWIYGLTQQRQTRLLALPYMDKWQWHMRR